MASLLCFIFGCPPTRFVAKLVETGGWYLMQCPRCKTCSLTTHPRT